MSQVVHQAGAYPGFCSMKQLGIFLLPPGWDASPSQGNNIHNTTKIHGLKNKRTTSKCGKNVLKNINESDKINIMTLLISSRLIPVGKHSFFDFSLKLCRGRGLVKQCALASKPPEFFSHLVQSKSFFKKMYAYCWNILCSVARFTNAM